MPAGVTVAGVKSILKSLRTRSGLRHERLQTTELALDVLERLNSVLVLRSQGIDGAEAIIRTVRDAATTLPVTERMIVDAALCLRLESAPEVIEELYDDDLSNRREALVKHWNQLHLGHGVFAPPQAPSVRALRLDREDIALGLLATALVSDQTETLAETSDGTGSGAPQDGAVVLGAAVLDLAFQVVEVPAINNTSTQASDFATRPGGKGLNQAVGIARLGTAARLIAPIGSDRAGLDVTKYLRGAHVDTSLLQVREGATPRTLVISSTNGYYWHLGWKNEHEIRLTAEFLRSDAVREALRSAAVLVLTLEPPRESLRSILRLIGEHKQAPLVLTASPPIDLHEPSLSADELRRVDYLVASRWELRMLLRETGASDDISDQDILDRLFVAGVGTVCIVEPKFCEIRRPGEEPLILPQNIPQELISITDSSASKDAFVSALATRIAQHHGKANVDDYRFAYLAMLVAGSRFGTATALPIETEIQQYEQRLMRQAGTDLAQEGAR